MPDVMSYEDALLERYGTVDAFERELLALTPARLKRRWRIPPPPTPPPVRAKRARQPRPLPGHCPACGLPPAECFVHGTFWKPGRA